MTKIERIGTRKQMNCGMFCEIIEYKYNDDITVLFDDGTIMEHRKYSEFKNGKIKNHNIKLALYDRIGEESISADGLVIKIIEYRSAKDIDILVVSDNRIIKSKAYKDFKDGNIHVNSCIKNKENLIGLENINKYGESFKIIDYEDYLNITVEFDNGYTMKTSSGSFRNKRCYSPYAKTSYGIGFIGDGKYNSNSDIKMYGMWSGIFTRCYNKKYQKDKPTYIGCSIDEQWCNFQNFAEWYVSNYYELGDENMQLDKDILYKNNKIYSKATCLIVPQRINTMFTSCKTVRGKYPIGVNYKNNKYYVRLNTIEKSGENCRIDLGYFSTPEEAFYAYKQAKESYIKQVADEYKSKYSNFPQKLYNAMYSYEVEITD